MYTNLQQNQVSNKKKPNDKPLSIGKSLAVRNNLRIPGWRIPNPVPIEAIKANPQIHFSRWTDLKRNVFNDLLFRCTRFHVVNISQSTIAKKYGVTRVHINRLVGQLEKDGLISRYYRHKKTCLYKISMFFLEPEIRKKLSKIFTALIFIPLYFLFPNELQGVKCTNYSCLFRYVTQKEEDIYITPCLRREVLSRERVPEECKCTYKREIETERRKNHKTLQKKEVVVNSYEKARILEKLKEKDYSKLIPPPIKEVTPLLSLSKQGQINLLVFPEHVIQFATKQLKDRGHGLKKPYFWFFKVCLEYCQQEKIKPDWSWSSQVKTILNLPLDGSPVIEKATTTKPLPIFNPENSIKRETEKISAQKMLTEITNFMNPETLTDLSSFMGQESAQKMREAFLKTTLCLELKEPETPADRFAMPIIERYREKFNVKNIPPIAQIPPSSRYKDAEPTIRKFEKDHKDNICTCYNCPISTVRYWTNNCTDEEYEAFIGRSPWAEKLFRRKLPVVDKNETTELEVELVL